MCPKPEPSPHVGSLPPPLYDPTDHKTSCVYRRRHQSRGNRSAVSFCRPWPGAAAPAPTPDRTKLSFEGGADCPCACRVPIVKSILPPAYTPAPCTCTCLVPSTAVTSLTEKSTPREPFKCATSDCESACAYGDYFLRIRPFPPLDTILQLSSRPCHGRRTTPRCWEPRSSRCRSLAQAAAERAGRRGRWAGRRLRVASQLRNTGSSSATSMRMAHRRWRRRCASHTRRTSFRKSRSWATQTTVLRVVSMVALLLARTARTTRICCTLSGSPAIA